MANIKVALLASDGGGPRNAVHERLDGRKDGRTTVVCGHRVGVTLGQGIYAALIGPGVRTYAIFRGSTDLVSAFGGGLLRAPPPSSAPLMRVTRRAFIA